MLPEDRLFIGLARFRNGFVAPLSGDRTDAMADADRVVQRLRQRCQERLTKEAQLPISAKRASKTKELSRNKQKLDKPVE
jgi:hypothetical protein